VVGLSICLPAKFIAKIPTAVFILAQGWAIPSIVANSRSVASTVAMP
jgi:hypothetical protein